MRLIGFPHSCDKLFPRLVIARPGAKTYHVFQRKRRVSCRSPRRLTSYFFRYPCIHFALDVRTFFRLVNSLSRLCQHRVECTPSRVTATDSLKGKPPRSAVRASSSPHRFRCLVLANTLSPRSRFAPARTPRLAEMSLNFSPSCSRAETVAPSLPIGQAQHFGVSSPDSSAMSLSTTTTAALESGFSGS